MAHERVLVRDTSDDGTECVATNRALHWRSTDKTCQWSRADWSAIDEVGWTRATHTLHVQVSPAPLTLQFQGRPRLPGFAAERVAAAHLLHTRVRLSDSCSATVVAVRDPDSDGVGWTVCFDPACDTGDPVVTGAMDDAMHELRRQAGC